VGNDIQSDNANGANGTDETYYKFLSVDYAFKVLEERYLKVSLISELNDIYDCQPRIVPVGDEHGYMSEEATERLFSDVPDTYGLLCFSKSYSSPLLWGHYAEQARGVVLGFRINPQRLPYRFDVQYQDERPVLRMPVGNTLSQADSKQVLTDQFGVKALSWEYEKEVRYVVPLADCLPQNRMYFVNFFARELRQVIIGPRSYAKPAYMRNFLADRYRGIQVSLYTAHMHPDRYEIEIRPFRLYSLLSPDSEARKKSAPNKRAD
jgi:hypothetical protein